MPRQVNQIIARGHGTDGQDLDSDQLLPAIENAGFIVSGKEPTKRLAEELAKAAIMLKGGGSTEIKVETLFSNLESILVHNPKAHAIYRTMWERCQPEAGESISVPLVEGCSPSEYKGLAQAKLQNIFLNRRRA